MNMPNAIGTKEDILTLTNVCEISTVAIFATAASFVSDLGRADLTVNTWHF